MVYGKYQLRLIHNDDYVVLYTGTLESVEIMLEWYMNHKQFFNGYFKIV